MRSPRSRDQAEPLSGLLVLAGIDRAERRSRLGMSALNSTGLREHAHLYLQELCQRTSYTTSLGVLEGAEVLYVDRVRGFRRRAGRHDLDLYAGSRVPAYCTAMGKLLLAFLPKRELDGLLIAAKLAKRGPHTITSKKALLEQLEEIRAAGFAVSDQELAAELYELAAPMRNEAREVVAAVGLSARSSTVAPELADALGAHVIASAGGISAGVGYRRDGDEMPGGG